MYFCTNKVILEVEYKDQRLIIFQKKLGIVSSYVQPLFAVEELQHFPSYPCPPIRFHFSFKDMTSKSYTIPGLKKTCSVLRNSQTAIPPMTP